MLLQIWSNKERGEFWPKQQSVYNMELFSKAAQETLIQFDKRSRSGLETQSTEQKDIKVDKIMLLSLRFARFRPFWEKLKNTWVWGKQDICVWGVQRWAVSVCVCLPVCLSVCLSVYLSVCLSICLSLSLSFSLTLSLSLLYLSPAPLAPLHSLPFSVCLSISISLCLSLWSLMIIQKWRQQHKTHSEEVILKIFLLSLISHKSKKTGEICQFLHKVFSVTQMKPKAGYLTKPPQNIVFPMENKINFLSKPTRAADGRWGWVKLLCVGCDQCLWWSIWYLKADT